MGTKFLNSEKLKKLLEKLKPLFGSKKVADDLQEETDPLILDLEAAYDAEIKFDVTEKVKLSND